nr:unnamed protein product [Digitaria exilis]
MEMEQQQIACYLCLFLAVLLPLLLLKLKKRGHGGHGAPPRLPPSPSRLPFIGNLHHLLLRGPLAHRAMAELTRRHDAPLMYLELGEVRVVVASTPDAAMEVMKTNDAAFASRPWIPSVRSIMASGAVGLVFSRYGALWRQLRKICVVELLSARRVHSFRWIREEEARRLVAGIAAASSSPFGDGAVNVGEQITGAITDAAVRTMMGDRFDRREEFLQVIAEGTKIIAGFSLSDLFPSSRLVNLLSPTSGLVDKIFRATFEIMDHAIRKHEDRRGRKAAMPPDSHNKEQDILDALLKIQKEGDHQATPLTMITIKCVIIDLFSGGSDTSSSSLQWAMSELMRNPRVMRKTQAELRNKLQGKPTVTEEDLVGLNYLKLVIKETLRIHPVFPLLLPRECREDCKAMGYDVPKGTTALVNAWAIGRDPRYWEDPDEFKPERFEDGKIDFKGTD